MAKLNDFPSKIRLQILFYLAADNFKAAKELYDLCLMNNSEKKILQMH